ncbi:MAG: DUF6879 family protein [Pseudonocardiaceae bacterium]
MPLDEAGLDEYTDRFTRNLFRQEVLPAYDVPSDGGDFGRYLRGENGPSLEVVGPWRKWVRSQHALGKTVTRVRLLTQKPSEYVSFECEWVYVSNVAAGEQIRILDLTERTQPDGLIIDEFWAVDDSGVVLMRYDACGRFTHGEVIEGATTQQYLRSRDIAWTAGEDFTSWWSRHPEYHRGNWQERARA